jgi:hypothetical protein
MKQTKKPRIIPKKACLKVIELNCTLSFAKIPIEAERKTAKPMAVKNITENRNILSTPKLFVII